jgi:hypothetical protein
MGCGPFLQRLGFIRIRPRQNAALDIRHLQTQKIPVEYPVQHIEQMPESRVDEPMHGVQTLYPYPADEIARNSNQ